MSIDLIADAFNFANKAHAGQLVKGTQIPYLSHPMHVASIVWEFGGTREQVAAAFLHDVIEDTDTSIEILRKHFGNLVATIVSDCSDSTGDPKPPWRERKEKYLKHLAEASHPETILVSLADKFHNVNRILNDLTRLKDRSDELWKLFSAPPDQIVWYYLALLNAFMNRMSDLPKVEDPTTDKTQLLLGKFQTAAYMLETKVSQILPEDYRVFYVDSFDDESTDQLWKTFQKRDEAVNFVRAYAKMKTWSMAASRIDDVPKVPTVGWADYLVVRYKDNSLLFSTADIEADLKTMPTRSEFVCLQRHCLENNAPEVEAFGQLIELIQRRFRADR
jgi:hypothetical protein